MAGRTRKPAAAKPVKSLEQRLWDAADALRGNQEPSEYKHVVLGLVFVKYISDRFEERRRAIEASLADPESEDYIPNVQNDAAVLELGDETLKKIASELVRAVQASATIDWSLKQSVRAAMRSKVRKLLARYDYPPDREEQAIDLVLRQAEVYAASDVAA